MPLTHSITVYQVSAEDPIHRGESHRGLSAAGGATNRKRPGLTGCPAGERTKEDFMALLTLRFRCGGIDQAGISLTGAGALIC